MSSRIKIIENHGMLEMTLERKNDHKWSKICSTQNTNIIYEFFKKAKDDITNVIPRDEVTSIILKNNIILHISNDINWNDLDIFKPLHEGLIKYNKAKQKNAYKKRIRIKLTLFAIVLFSVVNSSKVNQKASISFAKSIKLTDSLEYLDPNDEEKLDDVIELTNDNDNNDDIILPFEDNLRLMNIMNIMNEKNSETIDYEEYLPSFNTCSYDDKYLGVVENYGDIIEKYAEISGIDQDIINCLLAQERGVHSSVKDKLGTLGIAQIQVNQHLGSTLALHNEITEETEEFEVTMELLESLEGNIKTGVALLQRALIKYDGNILLALQAYNYGEGAMDTVIRNSGRTLEEINENYENLSWMDSVYEYSDNKGGYGDKEYLNNVLKRYPNNELTLIYGENPVTINVKTAEKVKRIAN